MSTVKEKVSSESMKKIQDKYLIDKIKFSRAALITGCPEKTDNILSAIADKLYNYDNILTIVTDIKDGMDFTLDKNIDEIITSHGNGIDILILGHSDMNLKWFEDYSYKDYEYIINTNLLSHMKLCNAFVNATIDKQYKKYIVIVGSMAYNNVLNGSIPYMVSKAGIAMLVRGLAWELAPKNFNVIGIHPSNTSDTPMTEKTIQKIMEFRSIDRESAEQYWSAVCPKGRFLSKDELANFVEFFISGKCDYLSGANIEFRGGQR